MLAAALGCPDGRRCRRPGCPRPGQSPPERPTACTTTPEQLPEQRNVNDNDLRSRAAGASPAGYSVVLLSPSPLLRRSCPSPSARPPAARRRTSSFRPPRPLGAGPHDTTLAACAQSRARPVASPHRSTSSWPCCPPEHMLPAVGIRFHPCMRALCDDLRRLLTTAPRPAHRHGSRPSSALTNGRCAAVRWSVVSDAGPRDLASRSSPPAASLPLLLLLAAAAPDDARCFILLLRLLRGPRCWTTSSSRDTLTPAGSRSPPRSRGATCQSKARMTLQQLPRTDPDRWTAGAGIQPPSISSLADVNRGRQLPAVDSTISLASRARPAAAPKRGPFQPGSNVSNGLPAPWSPSRTARNPGPAAKRACSN